MNYMKYENRNKEENLKRGLSLKDYDSLSALVTIISTDNVNVFIPSGTHLITADLTIPSNITLTFENGGILSVATTKTLTLNCGIEAGIYQIFAGAGTIAGTPLINCVYPEWFGVVGDGVTDDLVSLTLAFNNTLNNNLLLTKNYLVSDEIALTNIDNKKIWSETDSTITSETDIVLSFGGDIDNVKIVGINFVSSDNTGSHIYGLIKSLNRSVTNVKILSCSFTAPDSETNGIKLVVDTAGKEVDNVIIQNCHFNDLGRMGVEIQNHTYDSTYRYKDIKITNNTFYNLGGAYTFGFGVSFSGLGTSCIVSGNSFIDCMLGVEIAGGPDYINVCDNIVENLTTECTPFAVSNTTANPSSTFLNISNNTSKSLQNTYIYECDKSIISGNNLYVESVPATNVQHTILFRDCNNNIISDNQFYSKDGRVVLEIESANTTSVNNLIHNNRIDALDNTDLYSALRFDQSPTTNNIVTNCDIIKSAGQFFDSTNSASYNNVVNCSFNGDYYIYNYYEKTLSDANYEMASIMLTAKMLKFSGTLTATRTITIPSDVKKEYYIWNNTAESLVFTTGSGATITVLTTEKRILFCDGTNVLSFV